MESNKSMKQVFVLNVTAANGMREAIIAEDAVWCRVMPGVVERFIEIHGRMTDQETAHRWFDGHDFDLRDHQRDKRYQVEVWRRYWSKRPLRTYKVPASSLAYVEELEDLSMEIAKPTKDAAAPAVKQAEASAA